MLSRLNTALNNLDALLRANSAQLHRTDEPIPRALAERLVAEAAIAAARLIDRAPSAQYGPVARRLRDHEEEVASMTGPDVLHVFPNAGCC